MALDGILVGRIDGDLRLFVLDLLLLLEDQVKPQTKNKQTQHKTTQNNKIIYLTKNNNNYFHRIL